MTQAQILLSADEQLRLRECAHEPIQIPGAIQPHGALLAVDRVSLEILQVSENTAEILGIAALSLLGTAVSELVDVETEAFLRASFVANPVSPVQSLAAHVNGRPVDIVTHVVGSVGVVEFEPAVVLGKDSIYLSALHEASQRLAGASNAHELRHMMARELRELTGFDQVMAYHFHPDGHGEVVADDHVPGMTSYLGLHFPASDIPVQARRLYELKGSGLIATSDYLPAALVPTNNPYTGAPLDLSRAQLRSVSPHHLQFMRNMGQGASCTFSLLLDGQLLGLVTCAHRAPRWIPLAVRRMCEVLVQQVVLQLHAMTRTDALTRRLRCHDVRAVLVEQMNLTPDVARGLTDQTTTILDLMPADGAAVCIDNRRVRVGETPSDTQTTALLEALTGEDGSVSSLLTDSLARDRPALAELVPSFAGLFVLRFGRAGDCLLWFRSEIAQTVEWLGAQSSDNRSTPLSPRTSFESWRQTVTGSSLPWNAVDVTEASELARDIDRILLHRTEAQLAQMASHDSLTGLPNRHLLIDRITTALEREHTNGRGDEVAILFCDLDDFKRVNDTGGHAAGDAVLIEVSRRLQAVLRSGDSVARVGGDEFVVVLEPNGARILAPAPATLATSDPAEVDGEIHAEPPDLRRAALRIAERIKAELARPISYQGHEHSVSVSVGVTFAEPGIPAEDLIRNADAAMYRAKQTGKSSIAIFDDSMRATVRARAATAQALHTVFNPGRQHDPHLHPRLSVVYRPFVRLDSGRFLGFEVRPLLTDSDGQAIPLETFAAVAEDIGMINVLETAVLNSGLGAVADWQTNHPGEMSVRIAAVLSGAGLVRHANVAAVMQSALDSHGLRPSNLVIELTEAALIEAGPSTIRELTALRHSGAGITLGSFGTGYANLRHLATLPINAIKIDPSLTAALPHDVTSGRIVHAIAGLAANMNLACIVTGIDTRPQLDALPAGVVALGSLIGDPTPAPACDLARSSF